MKSAKHAASQLSEELQLRANEIWDTLNKTATSVSDEVIAGERLQLEEEIQRLEELLAEKKKAVAALETRREEARKQLAAMLIAGLSDEAILSAMRTQYRARRSAGHRSSSSQEKSSGAVSDEARQQVLDHLDTEGLTAGEIRKLVGPVSPTVTTVLKALVEDGAVLKEGTGKTARYKLKA